ncbi:hypothetical protein [Kordiimonas marina]|uniref:hypothetical protein n=1 Tax=Kordiimonas marina TaxID=2872312 RepID=UPI001FF0E9EA|nr:hypothetical protein [Kordiimonas marina]MCJ9430074.1 hypothetical protein [Kordiimonas marina]
MPLHRRDFLEACEWNPGLDHGERTLGEVLETLPGVGPEAIHWLVRLIENPRSPLAFPGQISLERHDALHVLLGRGLNNQDEAFVIGFTMGAARSARPWHRRLFLWIARHLYPAPYRLESDHEIAFELGFGRGRKHKVQDIHLIPIETMLGETVAAVRRKIGIDLLDLYSAYCEEKLRLPHTLESRRLDTDYDGIDPSAIRRPPE